MNTLENPLRKLTHSTPQNRKSMERMVRAVVSSQIELESLIAQRDAATIEAAKPFADNISDLNNQIARAMELLETWSDLNSSDFGDTRSLEVEGHRMGWRKGNWKSETKSRLVTWKKIVEKLKVWKKGAARCRIPADPKLAEEARKKAHWAGEWLRIKRSFDPARDTMIASRDDQDAKPLLVELGVIIDQDETFYLAPDREGQEGPLLTVGGAK